MRLVPLPAPLASVLFGCSLVACNTTSEAPNPPPEPTQASVSLDNWQTESIALPPSFAPDLPSGQESLLFAPGMFDQSAEDFWSYAFVLEMEIEELDAKAQTAMFELYFDGLLTSVASSKGVTLEDPALVAVHRVGPASFEGRVQLVDAFVSMEWIELHLVLEQSSASAKTTHITVMASPQPKGHPIWTDLSAARDALAP